MDNPSLTMSMQPKLDRPIAVIAFEGWNDAGSAASGAARFLTWRLGGQTFASIDPEPFFDFATVRPEVKGSSKGQREIRWPRNEFSFVHTEGPEPDIVLFVGTEPSLRWQGYTGVFSELFEALDVSMMVSLGALLADVPHTRSPRVTGSAVRTEVAERLGLATSRYEGPTGIVGVLTRALSDGGLETASLWANVPHYITADRNPPATLALLERLEVFLDRRLDLRELNTAAGRFQAEVDQAIGDNAEVMEYVSRLEEAWDSGGFEDEAQPESDLPPASDVVLDIEDYLREQRGEDEL